MSNQISGLISRYMTNSKPQDTTQTNTQSYGLLRQRGDQATVLDFSPERAMDQGATSAAMSYSRRRDAATTHVTAGGPTLRRTAAPQTTRPNTDGSVSGLDTARRIYFSFRLTNDPARSTTSANSSPPDGLASALPAGP